MTKRTAAPRRSHGQASPRRRIATAHVRRIGANAVTTSIKCAKLLFIVAFAGAAKVLSHVNPRGTASRYCRKVAACFAGPLEGYSESDEEEKPLCRGAERQLCGRRWASATRPPCQGSSAVSLKVLSTGQLSQTYWSNLEKNWALVRYR